jgi:hypothetical protein
MKCIFLLLSLYSVLFARCVFDCKSYLDKNIKPLNIDGIVMDKQKAKTGCFGVIILKHENNLDTLLGVCYCVPEGQGLWKYVMNGDSLHKANKSLIVEVYRKDSVRKFEYPCCSQ